MGFVLRLIGVLVLSPLACLGQAPANGNVKLAEQAIPCTLLQPLVDNARVQAELSRLGGLMVERHQVLPKPELLKHRVRLPLELPNPATVACEDVELANRCREAVVVVARLTRLGASNAWVALPASGFFISSSGTFVTSSHVIHDPDYEGMVVLTGDGRVLPVRAVLADDEQCDVAILKADGGPVTAFPLEASVDVGARVAVMSHPVGRFFTFAQGVVTRRSLQHEGSHSQEVLEISAEFGPGSSGAPVVNQRGSVVGWVNTLRMWPDPAMRGASTTPTLTFRECGGAADLLRLVQQIRTGPSRVVAVSDRPPGQSGASNVNPP